MNPEVFTGVLIVSALIIMYGFKKRLTILIKQKGLKQEYKQLPKPAIYLRRLIALLLGILLFILMFVTGFAFVYPK